MAKNGISKPFGTLVLLTEGKSKYEYFVYLLCVLVFRASLATFILANSVVLLPQCLYQSGVYSFPRVKRALMPSPD